MNGVRQYEVLLILGALVLMVGLVSWLILSQIWGRRRVPERIHPRPFRPPAEDASLEVKALYAAISRPIDRVDPSQGSIILSAPPAGSIEERWQRAWEWPSPAPLPFDWARDLHAPEWELRRV